MNFDHVVIAVADLEASLGWYATVLETIGFRKTRDHVWVNAAGGAVDVQQARQPSHFYLRAGVGVNHLAFNAGTPDALAAVAERLRAAGLEVPALQDFGDTVALFMKDRDGMRIELAAYRRPPPH